MRYVQIYLVLLVAICNIACQPEPESVNLPDSGCKPYLTACKSKGVSFAINADVYAVEAALPATLTFVEAPAKLLDARLTGQNMYMGYIPVVFTAAPLSLIKTEPVFPSLYKGDIYLASCTRDDMRWRLNITYLDLSGNEQKVYFDFDSP